MSKIAYLPEIPDCDLCGKGTKAYADANVRGRWGYVCKDCFKKHGCSLGTGAGQELKLESERQPSQLDVNDLDDFEELLEEYENDGICSTDCPEGCRVEIDGKCIHGYGPKLNLI